MSYSYNNIIAKQEPKEKARLDQALRGAAHSLPGGGKVDNPAPGLDVLVARPLLAPAECQALLAIACDDIGFTFWADANAEVPVAAATAAPGASDAPSAASEPAATGSDDDEGVMLPGERQYYATEVAQRTATKNAAAACEQGGPEVGGNASVAALDRAFRSADTIECDLPELTELMWARLATVMPTELHMTEDLSEGVAPPPPPLETSLAGGDVRVGTQEGLRDTIGRWVPVGLAPNLLFARYTEGGHFAPHVDGSTVKDLNERSFYTVLVYLNTCEKGGETHIMTGDQQEVLTKDAASGRMCGSGANRVYAMKPEEGAAIVFGAEVLHEGSAVGAPDVVEAPGATSDDPPQQRTVHHAKYIIRGDVMFRRDPPLLDGEKDREAFETYQAARLAEADGDTERAVGLFRRVRRLSPGLADVYQL